METKMIIENLPLYVAMNAAAVGVALKEVLQYEVFKQDTISRQLLVDMVFDRADEILQTDICEDAASFSANNAFLILER